MSIVHTIIGITIIHLILSWGVRTVDSSNQNFKECDTWNILLVSTSISSRKAGEKCAYSASRGSLENQTSCWFNLNFLVFKHSFRQEITHSLLKMWYSSFPHNPTSRKRRRRKGRKDGEKENVFLGSSGLLIGLQLMIILLLQHPLPAAGEDSATPDLKRNLYKRQVGDLHDILIYNALVKFRLIWRWI